MDKMSSKKEETGEGKVHQRGWWPEVLIIKLCDSPLPRSSPWRVRGTNSSRDSAVIGTHRYVLVDNCLLEAGHGRMKRSHLAR